MGVVTGTRLDVVPLTRHIGAEIRGLDLRDRPGDETIGAIYQSWLDHLVIVFPGQNLSQDDLVRITGYFGALGDLHRPPKYFPKGYSSLLPGIMLISNIRENGEPIGALPDGEMMFHHDMIHAEVPSKATLLYSVEIPSAGGNTLFASGYAAYDTLDPAIRRRLEGRRALHHYNYGSTRKGDGRGTAAFGECVHPVFRTHEDTGKKAVYVNRLMTVGIVDMAQAESARCSMPYSTTPRNGNSSTSTSGGWAISCCGTIAARRTRAPIFPPPAPADAAHHREGDGAAVLIRTRAPSLRLGCRRKWVP